MTPQSLLLVAEQLLGRVLKFEQPVDALVSRFFKDNRQLGARDRAVLADTIYEVLRHKARYEYFASTRSMAGMGTLERCLLMQAWQGDTSWIKRALSEQEVQWLDGIAHIGIDAASLPEAAQYNLPLWLVDALKKQLGTMQAGQESVQDGASFEAFAQSINQPAQLDLRVNLLKNKREAVARQLAETGVQTTATPYSPWGLRVEGKPTLHKNPLYLDGSVEVQDEGSQLLALLVAPRRGEVVVDFCAGAGGKTLALGAMMRNTGRLYAWDTSAHRLDALKPRLARSGISIVYPAAITHEGEERVKRLYGKVDRVLVDAPCSGLGTLRRNPDLKWRQSPDTVAQYAHTQYAILNAACKLLKSGGRLVYATCSILPDENENIVAQFEQAHPEFISLQVQDILDKQGVHHAQTLVKGPYLRLWPHVHHTDGFFAAVWQKK